MNPERKQLWLDALESGEYEQTTVALRDMNGFCCLGVACDVYAKATGMQWDEQAPGRYSSVTAYTMFGSDGDLPSAVMEWFGLESSDPDVVINPNDFGGFIRSLSSCNDQLQMKFKDIAQLIREQL
jgi:hypothetical protein